MEVLPRHVGQIWLQMPMYAKHQQQMRVAQGSLNAKMISAEHSIREARCMNAYLKPPAPQQQQVDKVILCTFGQAHRTPTLLMDAICPLLPRLHSQTSAQGPPTLLVDALCPLLASIQIMWGNVHSWCHVSILDLLLRIERAQHIVDRVDGVPDL